jgi:hypothetical protein
MLIPTVLRAILSKATEGKLPAFDFFRGFNGLAVTVTGRVMNPDKTHLKLSFSSSGSVLAR